MSNIPRYFGAGAPFNGELPSAAIEHLDSNLAKCPNAEEGSAHTGSCEFGGLKAPHITNTTAAVYTWSQSGAGPHATTRTLDLDVASAFPIEVGFQDPCVATLTLDVQNPRVGDELVVAIEYGNTEPGLVIVWGGAGITHQHADYDDQCHPGDGHSVFRGFVIEGLDPDYIIRWSVTRSGL